MPESKILKEFYVCPYCGNGWLKRLLRFLRRLLLLESRATTEIKTVSKIACDKLVEQKRLKLNTFSSLVKQMIPLINPQSAALTVPVVILHHDYCADCGAEILIRVETQEAPIQMAPGGRPQGDMPPFSGKVSRA